MPVPATGPITSFDGLIAVVTGGGTGMGRELTVALAASGCHVAICDVSQEAMDETVNIASEVSPPNTRLTSFVADVSDAAALHAFAAHVGEAFHTMTINLLFNNAGIAGAGSVVIDDPAQWDRVFGVCWGGVLNGTRSFMPMLLAAERGQVVNTSSINGMWACLGPHGPHTAYSAAKFAVKGFTEALIVDFRMHAPHLTAAVVMPGHIGTAILRNSFEASGRDPKHLQDEFIAEVRDTYAKRGIDLSSASDEDIRLVVAMRVDEFEHDAPTTAAAAAAVILDGIRAGEWRILVGDDANALDHALRADPTAAYDEAFTAALTDQGHYQGLIA
jgi:NAD(P)-dependent dehydrogenase (short-subunit alcohol dehydrogenase family)